MVPYNPKPTKVKGLADELNRPVTFLEHQNCTLDEYAKDIAVYNFIREAANLLTREVGMTTSRVGWSQVTSNLTSSAVL